MKEINVVGLLEKFDQNDIEVYVDGGWGVDALLGKQTRDHGDLDLAMARQYESKFGELMEELEFVEFEREGNWEANYTLRNPVGDEIDMHVGVIGGRAVKTIDPKWMVEFHTWYEPDDDDYQDVKLLCDKYGIPLPAVYDKFKEK